MTTELAENLYSVFVFGIVALFAFMIAYRAGFLTFFPSPPIKISWRECIFYFILFLIIQFIAIPLAIALVVLKMGNHATVSLELLGWMNIGAVFVLCIALSIAALYTPSLFASFFKSPNPLREIRIGVATWLIAYPTVMFLSQGILIILTDLYGYTLIDQQAVKQVKIALQYPVMFALTFLMVVFIVPCIEEILFRGFLYSTLRCWMNRWGTIVLTSAIFALFHFAFSQGVNNINILISLFILSLFLGFLREKYGNLISSIALHGTFNAISMVMIMFYIE